jgi:hypothetical protein
MGTITDYLHHNVNLKEKIYTDYLHLNVKLKEKIYLLHTGMLMQVK